MDKKNFGQSVKLVIEKFLKKGAIPLGYGRHKATFAHGNFVYRVPIGINCVEEVFIESEICKATKEGRFEWDDCYIIPAKLRLVIVGGIPVQVMEKLRPCARYTTRALKEEWLVHLESCGDGRQVGHNKKGILKAYDFSDIRDVIGERDPLITKAREQAASLVKNFDENEWWLDHGFLERIGAENTPGTPSADFIQSKGEAFAFT